MWIVVRMPTADTSVFEALSRSQTILRFHSEVDLKRKVTEEILKDTGLMLAFYGDLIDHLELTSELENLARVGIAGTSVKRVFQTWRHYFCKQNKESFWYRPAKEFELRLAALALRLKIQVYKRVGDAEEPTTYYPNPQSLKQKIRTAVSSRFTFYNTNAKAPTQTEKTVALLKVENDEVGRYDLLLPVSDDLVSACSERSAATKVSAVETAWHHVFQSNWYHDTRGKIVRTDHQSIKVRDRVFETSFTEDLDNSVWSYEEGTEPLFVPGSHRVKTEWWLVNFQTNKRISLAESTVKDVVMEMIKSKGAAPYVECGPSERDCQLITDRWRFPDATETPTDGQPLFGAAAFRRHFATRDSAQMTLHNLYDNPELSAEELLQSQDGDDAELLDWLNSVLTDGSRSSHVHVRSVEDFVSGVDAMQKRLASGSVRETLRTTMCQRGVSNGVARLVLWARPHMGVGDPQEATRTAVRRVWGAPETEGRACD